MNCKTDQSPSYLDQNQMLNQNIVHPIMADHKEQAKPLTAPSPAATDPIEPASWRSFEYLQKRRYALWCGGCCGATVVILGLTILILAFTVFKVRDPILTLNAIHVNGIQTGLGSSLERPISVNATLTADISIENPNFASFKYDNSTTEFYYEGAMVGLAYAPDGSVGEHQTSRMNVTVDVLGDRVGETNATSGFLAGNEVNVTSYTDCTGRVNVIGIYKRDVEVVMNCSMTIVLAVGSDLMRNKVCEARLK